MPARDQRRRKLSSTIAAIERHHPDADTTDLRQQLAEARYEERARDLVAGWPAFSDETRSRLRTLLRPVVGGEAA